MNGVVLLVELFCGGWLPGWGDGKELAGEQSRSKLAKHGIRQLVASLAGALTDVATAHR
jgi:hypothetical protein